MKLCLILVVTLTVIATIVNIFLFNIICLIFNMVALILLGVAGFFWYQNKHTINTATDVNTGTLSKKKFWIIFGCIAVIGIFVRTVAFTVVPGGLNQDEASMLYDAYSLLKFGVDRNGTSFPVYFEAWGDGQNALLTYLTIPFIAMFGMNVFTARIVSLLFSIGSIFAFYYLLKLLFKNQRLALVGMAFFAICPYTIMISRWGLESNLLPHMLLYSAIFLVKAYDKLEYLFPACILFGLSLYAYAISYLYIPLILICFYLYFIIKKKINKHNLWIFILSNVILFLIALPLILFLMVNYGWIGEINIGAISIHKMRALRVDEIGFNNFLLNLRSLLKIFIFQNDNFHHNSFFNLGFMYILSIPFFIYGLILNIKNIYKHKCKFCDFFILVMFLCALLLSTLIARPNVNKINIIWLSVLFYISYGLYNFIVNNKLVRILTMVSFALLFGCFSGLYFTHYNEVISPEFNKGMQECISYAKNITDNNDTIYFSNCLREPYIYCLIVDHKDPYEFLETRNIVDKTVIMSYGKYQFNTEITEIEQDKVYIMSVNEFNSKFKESITSDNYQVFDYFVVIFR